MRSYLPNKIITESAPTLFKRLIVDDRKKISLPNSISLELLHRVDEAEKAEILSHFPFFKPDIFAFDNYHPEKPYKIILGEGAFCTVRLARITQSNNGDTPRYYIAVRKIKSQEKLSTNKIISRDDVIKTTEDELKLQSKLIELGDADNIALSFLVVESQNKKKEKQLYQCMPFADIGNGSHFIKMMENADLTEAEKSVYIKYITNVLLNQTRKINDKNFYLRDIKPENILFSSNGEIWLSDLGSSAYYSPEGEKIIASRLSDVRYKPPYLIFGQLNDKEKDTILDSWALALTLLQFFDTTLNYYIQNSFHDLVLNSQKQNARSASEIKEHFLQIINKLKRSDCFKKLPDPLQSILLGLLELDVTERKTITQLIDEYDKENILRKHDEPDEKNQIRAIFRKIIMANEGKTNKLSHQTSKINTNICSSYIDDNPNTNDNKTRLKLR